MNTPVTINQQEYLAPSWSDMGKLTVSLAEKIEASGQKFDRIIALAKGGLGWSRQLQDLLRIPEGSSIQVSMYEGIYTTKKSPIVIQSLPISIKGESILVFDDVVDSGETIEIAKNYFHLHGAVNVKTAAHFTKPWTKIHPDYSVKSTESWIIFPHDAVEMIYLLDEKWNHPETTVLRDNLIKIGIEAEIVDFTLKHL